MYEKKTEATRCAVARQFDILNGKWNLMLICALSEGAPLRYGELRRRMNGITDMALSNALKALQKAEIVRRQAYNEVPPRVEYSLTEKGKALIPVVKTACRWSVRHESGADREDPYCWQLQRERTEKAIVPTDRPAEEK